MGDRGGGEPRLEALQMQRGYILVGHQHDPVLAQHRTHQRAGLLQQARTDDDVVAARAERDAQALRAAHVASATTPRWLASVAMTASSVASGGPSMVSTVMSASA